MLNIYGEVESIVLAHWDDAPEQIALEVSERMSISIEYAEELVMEVIDNEIAIDGEIYSNEKDFEDDF